MTPTITIKRQIGAPAKKVYQAFLDPDVLAKYQVPEGGRIIYDGFVAAVGAENRYTMGEGDRSMAFKIKFLELIEFTTIRHKYAFDMDGPMGIEMEICITLRESDDVTHLKFEQYGLPEPIPKEGAIVGWSGMLDRLKVLMEAG